MDIDLDALMRAEITKAKTILKVVKHLTIDNVI